MWERAVWPDRGACRDPRRGHRDRRNQRGAISRGLPGPERPHPGHRRTPPRQRPVRRPRRVHHAGRGARRRGDARAPDPLLRRRRARSSSATAGRSRSSSATRSWPSGGRRSPTRTTPSGAVRAALELVDAVRRARGRTRGARRRPDRRGRGHARRRRTRAWSPATSSTPRSRLQSAAAPGTVLVGEATQRAGGWRDRLRAGRRADRSRARPLRSRPGARCASSPSDGGIGRGRSARGPVRGPRRRAAAPQGPVPRHRARAARRLVSIIGVGRHRQEPAGLGVLEVRRRRRRAGLVASTAAPRRTARGSPSGRSGEMVRGARGLVETDDDETTRARRRDPRRVRSRCRGAAPDRARPARPARRRRRRLPAAPRHSSGHGGSSSSGWPRTGSWRSSSKTCTGPTPARSTSSTTCSSGAAASRS